MGRLTALVATLAEKFQARSRRVPCVERRQVIDFEGTFQAFQAFQAAAHTCVRACLCVGAGAHAHPRTRIPPGTHGTHGTYEGNQRVSAFHVSGTTEGAMEQVAKMIVGNRVVRAPALLARKG